VNKTAANIHAAIDSIVIVALALEDCIWTYVQLGIGVLPGGSWPGRVDFADEGQLPVTVERLPGSLRREGHAAGIGQLLTGNLHAVR